MRPWFLLAALLSAQTDAPPPPDAQAALIARVRQKAVDYSQGLSDFLCTQVTRRSLAKIVPGQEPVWTHQDTFTIELSYLKHHEDYRVVKVNEKRVRKTLGQVGGHWTEGEFGSFLEAFFLDQNQARLQWDRWSSVDGRRVAVLKLRIEQSHSTFETRSHRGLHGEKFNWGVEGELAVDPETQQVITVIFHAVDIPPQRSLKELQVFIEYGNRKIGDREFLLPVRSWSRINIYGQLIKAEAEFTNYRKFSSDADIKFDAVEK